MSAAPPPDDEKAKPYSDEEVAEIRRLREAGQLSGHHWGNDPDRWLATLGEREAHVEALFDDAPPLTEWSWCDEPTHRAAFDLFGPATTPEDGLLKRVRALKEGLSAARGASPVAWAVYDKDGPLNERPAASQDEADRRVAHLNLSGAWKSRGPFRVVPLSPAPTRDGA